MTKIEIKIYNELVCTCSILGAGSDLLSIVASKDDTLDDNTLLQELQAWNSKYSKCEYKHIPYQNRWGCNPA